MSADTIARLKITPAGTMTKIKRIINQVNLLIEGCRNALSRNLVSKLAKNVFEPVCTITPVP